MTWCARWLRLWWWAACAGEACLPACLCACVWFRHTDTGHGVRHVLLYVQHLTMNPQLSLLEHPSCSLLMPFMLMHRSPF
jgi:hypothetical protein